MQPLLKLLKIYGLFGSLRLVRDVVLSRIFFNKARIIRYPWYVRGASGITFGKGFTAGVGLRADAFGNHQHQIEFGINVQVGDYVHIAAFEKVQIGDNVLMASKVYISDHDHGIYRGAGDSVSKPEEIQAKKPLVIAPVIIGRNVWIGENVCILKGVDIGENSIVGASSVVTRSVPANSIVAGNPAKVLKRFDFEKSAWVAPQDAVQ